MVPILLVALSAAQPPVAPGDLPQSRSFEVRLVAVEPDALPRSLQVPGLLPVRHPGIATLQKVAQGGMTLSTPQVQTPPGKLGTCFVGEMITFRAAEGGLKTARSGISVEMTPQEGSEEVRVSFSLERLKGLIPAPGKSEGYWIANVSRLTTEGSAALAPGETLALNLGVAEAETLPGQKTPRHFLAFVTRRR